MRLLRALARMFLTLGLLCILAGFLIIRKEDIETIIHTYISPQNVAITLDDKNEYYRDYDFLFVQNTNDFSPKDYQDILNIYYTVINSGKSSFTFYCPKKYEGCLSDIHTLANNQDLLSDINNYVHPYNGFSHIETEYDTFGKVTISIVKSYSPEDIILINQKIDELLPQLTTGVNLEEDIKSIHDYIINHTKYDSNRSDYNIIQYKSDIAYGPLFEGYAICGGYTDLMELFLERLGVKSYKVASNDHVWNAVYLNNSWYHLDLTWDDPITSDGRDYLDYYYFLIDTNTLIHTETTQHTFNQNVYLEMKEEA